MASLEKLDIDKLIRFTEAASDFEHMRSYIIELSNDMKNGELSSKFRSVNLKALETFGIVSSAITAINTGIHNGLNIIKCTAVQISLCFLLGFYLGQLVALENLKDDPDEEELPNASSDEEKIN